jgi:hypothetical protein
LKETQRQEKYKQTTEAQKMIKESNESNGKSSGLTKTSRKSEQTSTPIDKKILALEQKKLPEKAAWSKKINAKISKEQKRLKRLREQEAGGPVDNNQDNQENNKNDEDDDGDDGEADWKELVMEKKTLKKLKLDLDHQKSIDRLPITDHSNPAQSSSGFDKNLGEFFLGLA